MKAISNRSPTVSWTGRYFEDFTVGDVYRHPLGLSEMPLQLRRATRLAFVLAAASMPDRHGYFSLGPNADYVAAFIGEVPFFAEANAQMPRTRGENQLHISHVAGWCTADYALHESPPAIPDERDERIAAFVAERVRDGTCRQIGVGRIPNALLVALRGHRHLGLHPPHVSTGSTTTAPCRCSRSSGSTNGGSGTRGRLRSAETARCHPYADGRDRAWIRPVELTQPGCRAARRTRSRSRPGRGSSRGGRRLRRSRSARA
jgi:hypothetical protein